MSAGVLSAPGARPNVEYHGVFTDATTSGTGARTFNNVPFGNPASDRLIRLGVVYGAFSDTEMTVTIGGNSASRAGFVSRGDCQIAWYEYDNYSANDLEGTVVITPSNSTNGMIVFVYSISRRGAYPADQSAFGFYPTTSGTLDYPENGMIHSVSASLGASGTGENLTDLDILDGEAYLSGNGNLAAASQRSIPTSTTLGETVTLSTATGTAYCWHCKSIAPE